jgi:hypothetical protein
MSFPLSMSLMRHVSFLGCAVVFAAGVASAQSTASQDPSNATGYSSSQDGLSASGIQLAEFALPASPTAGAAASEGGSGAGQYGNGGGSGGGGRHALLHSWTFEAGAGFNGPIGNDTNQAGVVFQSNGAPEPIPVITWGANFTLGGGLRFSDRLSALAEYQFVDDKLPGALISAVNNATGDVDEISAGNSHINSITGSPVIDLFPKKSNGIYLVGGFGWYHKSTNFQAPEAEISYYGEYYENVTVTSFTSSQWGGNAGLGIYHRLGSMYGGDNKTQIFAEARYTFIHTPPATQDNGLGTTELIPVTFGVRF